MRGCACNRVQCVISSSALANPQRNYRGANQHSSTLAFASGVACWQHEEGGGSDCAFQVYVYCTGLVAWRRAMIASVFLITVLRPSMSQSYLPSCTAAVDPSTAMTTAARYCEDTSSRCCCCLLQNDCVQCSLPHSLSLSLGQLQARSVSLKRHHGQLRHTWVPARMLASSC